MRANKNTLISVDFTLLIHCTPNSILNSACMLDLSTRFGMRWSIPNRKIAAKDHNSDVFFVVEDTLDHTQTICEAYTWPGGPSANDPCVGVDLSSEL